MKKLDGIMDWFTIGLTGERHYNHLEAQEVKSGLSNKGDS